MKQITHLLITIIILATPVFAQNQSTTPSPQETLKAIDAFSKSPLGPEAKKTDDIIWRFFGDSKSTNFARVYLFPEFAPFTELSAAEPKPPENIVRALRTATLAGNLRPQLKTGVIGNQPYAGLQEMIRTYNQLQQADKTLRVQQIENFVDLEAKNQLKQYVDEIVKKKKYPTK